MVVVTYSIWLPLTPYILKHVTCDQTRQHAFVRFDCVNIHLIALCTDSTALAAQLHTHAKYSEE
jgi:hypothetical protein